MSALAAVFQPPWVAMINFGHVLALVLAVGGACYAPRRYRALAAVMVLATLTWPVGVAVSAWIASSVGAGSTGVLAWSPLLAALPMWLAIVVGIVAVWRDGAPR